MFWTCRDPSWLKIAIASASKSAVSSGDESSSEPKRGPGRPARSSLGGTPQAKRGSGRTAASTSGKKRRRSTGSDAEDDEGEDKQEQKKRAVTESRLARGGRVASAGAAAAAIAATRASAPGAETGSPDILKPVGNGEREHLDPYIAKLQKRQRQQQRYAQTARHSSVLLYRLSA